MNEKAVWPMLMPDDEYYMGLALEQARIAAEAGEIPIGAVVVARGRVIAREHNRTEQMADVTAHAEILALGAASNVVGGKYLDTATLYVTVEPCPMCAGALGWSRIGRIVIGADDLKRGYSTVVRPGASFFHPKTTVVRGICKEECAALMRDFFTSKRC